MPAFEKNQLVAVYGTLKRNFPNHSLLQDSTFVGLDYLKGIALYNLGWFPAARLEEHSSVHVEIFAVSSKTLSALDHLEGYRPDSPEASFYCRMQLASRFGQAWLYVFNQPLDDFSRIPSGRWTWR